LVITSTATSTTTTKKKCNFLRIKPKLV
jgi:hypothetical protein